MCRIYPVANLFVFANNFQEFIEFRDRCQIERNMMSTKFYYIDCIEKCMGLELAPENLVIMTTRVDIDLNFLRYRIRKPSQYGETFETRFWFKKQKQQEVCLFIGGPKDGHKMLVDDDMRVISVPVFPEPMNLWVGKGGAASAATLKVARYLRQEFYENDRKSMTIYYYDDGEGWFTKLVNGYKPGYSNFEPEVF